VCRRQHAEVSGVNSIKSIAPQSFRQCRRKLRIDEEQQLLLRWNNGMIGLPCGKRENGVKVGVLQIVVVSQNILRD
jgi:hypothetical protein